MFPFRRLFCRILVVCALLGAAFAPSASAYQLWGGSWPVGATINMQLQLAGNPHLQDGLGDWNGSAADALASWNAYLDLVQFSWTKNAGAPTGNGNGYNNVFFASTIYGDKLDGNTLAVTTRWFSDSTDRTVTENDVIFNNAKSFDSYRGPLQVDPNIGRGAFDFHRVAIHEFGHVLGLDHEYISSGYAIMDATIGNLDHQAADDIAGVQALYGAKITSPPYFPPAQVGTPFSYEMTTNAPPLSYGASGLPAGLQINASTGLVSGTPSATGDFTIVLSAHWARRDASISFRWTVYPRFITSGSPPDVVVGNPFRYQITADNNTTGYSVDNLPDWVEFDPSSGVLSGTPLVVRSYTFTVTAHGSLGDAIANLSVTVLPPQITSSPRAIVAAGADLSYAIQCTNPVTSFGAGGLPAGLKVDAATGLISGAVLKSGTFRVTLVAHTAFGDANKVLTLQVTPPRISSASMVQSSVGSELNYQIAAGRGVTRFSTSGLPLGLALDPMTGVVTGVPSLTGTYTVTVTAHADYGNATAKITLQVLPWSEPPVATLPFGTGQIVLDQYRNRLYVADWAHVWAVDAKTQQIVGSVPIAWRPDDMCISVDGAKLWVVQAGLRAIDLDTFTLGPEIAGTERLRQVTRGSGDWLYGIDYLEGVVQVNYQTGAMKPVAVSASDIDSTADGKQLIALQGNSVFNRLDVTGIDPVAIGSFQFGSYLGSASLSRDTNLLFSSSNVSRGAGVTKIYSTSNPSGIPLELKWRNRYNAGPVSTTSDNLIGVQYAATAVAQPLSQIIVFDLRSGIAIDSITLPAGVTADGDLVIDPTDSYIFATASAWKTPYRRTLVYPLHRPVAAIIPAPHTLANLSTRAFVSNGDEAAIGGFIVQGDKAKTVVLRATGPWLALSGLKGAMADPTLDLYRSDGTLVESNDNWNSHRDAILATGVQPQDEHEPAIVVSLPPDSYTAVVSSADGRPGVALVELYDLEPTSSRVANISTRANVGAGDNVMIGGFIIGGDQLTKVIVRAIGPSLGSAGVSGALADPVLELHNLNGSLLAQNDNWQTDQAQEITASGVAPTDGRESAIVQTLQPGGYTAIVRGANGTSGVGLVEVYNLEN